MTWRQFQHYLKGKVFLIGLTFVDQEGEVIERYQTHGTVKRLTNDGIFKIRREDHSLFQIPYDKDTIKLAKHGEYREKSTGETIKDPDFIMVWEIVANGANDLEQVKKFGYIPKAG